VVALEDTPLSMSTLGLRTEAFAESDLLRRVDVVDWASTSPGFRQHIASHNLPLKA
jgi:hypothetical protein